MAICNHNGLFTIIAFVLTCFCLTQHIVALESSDHLLAQNKTSQNKKNKIVIDDISYGEMVREQRTNNPKPLILPYRQRRKTWGATLSLGYSLWNPDNYVSFFRVTPQPGQPQPQQPQGQSFESLYGSPSIGYISFLASVKLNNPMGAFSLGLGAGYYGNRSEDENLRLHVIPLVLEATLTIDTVMKEPYVAPFGGVGLAYVTFIESQTLASQGNPNPGNPGNPDNPNLPEDDGTLRERAGQFALYFNAGLLIQLNWLEPSAARSLYLSGVENTYIKAGVMKFFRNINFRGDAPTNPNNDPSINNENKDLISDLTFYLGLQLEF